MTENPFAPDNSSDQINPFATPVAEPSQSPQVPNSEPEKKEEENPSPESIEESLASMAELPAHEDGGESFWMVQQVAWGILKSLIVLGVIALLIWIIWSPGGHAPTKPETDLQERSEVQTTKKPSVSVTKKSPSLVRKIKDTWEKITAKKEEKIAPRETTPTQKEEPIAVQKTEPAKTTPEKPSVPETQIPKTLPTDAVREDAIIAVSWNQGIEEKRLSEFTSILEMGAIWLKEVRAFFEVPLPTMIAGTTREIRAQKIEHVLDEMWKLLERSITIRKTLLDQSNELNLRADNEKSIVSAQEKIFLQAVSNQDPQGMERSLALKGEADKNQVVFSGQAAARQVLLNEMADYDNILRNNWNLVTANKAALIEDIKVVDFPGDPFQRVIPKSDWQNSLNPAGK